MSYNELIIWSCRIRLTITEFGAMWVIELLGDFHVHRKVVLDILCVLCRNILTPIPAPC